MPPLSISKAWEEARSIMSRDSGLFVTLALALLVLPQIVAGVVATPTSDSGAAGKFLMLVAALLGLVGQLAIIRLSLGSGVSVGEAISHGFRRFPMLFLSMLLLVILYGLLLIPVALVASALGVAAPQDGVPASPGVAMAGLVIFALLVLLWPKFSLTAAVASEEKAGPVQILRRSWDLTKGHYGRLLGLMVLMIILALILLLPAGIVGGLLGKMISRGLEPFSLGAFLAALISGLAQAFFSVVVAVLLARVYVQLNAAQPSVPHVER
jgi:hypothetical protein